MNTPETRALRDYPHSPWRLKAHLLYATIREASAAHAMNEEYAVALISNWLAEAYSQGVQDANQKPAVLAKEFA